MDRAELIGRLRGAVTNPWRPTGPPRMTPWAWAADVILAFVLAAATVDTARNPQDTVGPFWNPRVPYPVLDGLPTPPAPPVAPTWAVGPEFGIPPQVTTWL
ncbi:MAG TPA: hypothetical protein VKB69_01200, partial [Micromonosporaceae bacterium]|nr:hypothetical protein [Micromonosporaceae bacterium]